MIHLKYVEHIFIWSLSKSSDLQYHLSLSLFKYLAFIHPHILFFLTWRFFLYFLCLACLISLLHPCIQPASILVFMGFFAYCMQNLLIYSFSHPHYLGLIASFTIMVSSPNLSSERETEWPSSSWRAVWFYLQYETMRESLTFCWYQLACCSSS